MQMNRTNERANFKAEVQEFKDKLADAEKSFAAERTAFADERTAFANERTAFAEERTQWEKAKSQLEKALLAEKAAHKAVEVKLSPHLQTDALIDTSKADVWNQGIATNRVSAVEKPLPAAARTLPKVAKRAVSKLKDNVSLRAEADLYKPVCDLLDSLIAKTQGIVFDTHDTAYLNHLKPDITVSAPTILRPHGAYARLVMELKSRGVMLDASCRGQVLNYIYAQAKMQPFRTRFTALLSNIDENVFIVLDRKPDGSAHACAYLPVDFEQAVEFLVGLTIDERETPLHPYFSSGLGKIQQHLGLSTKSVVASFRLPKTPKTDDTWYWTAVGVQAARKKAEICVKRSTVDTKPTPFRDEIKILEAIAAVPGDRCPHLPILLFATHDSTEYGMLPVGRPVDLVVLNQTPGQTHQILRDVLAGMDWLHEHGWIHRDIRWDNIVLDRNSRGVLAGEVCGEYMGGWICVPPRLLADDAMHKPYIPEVGDDYHAMILLINTLLYPYSVRGFDSSKIGFAASDEHQSLCELWEWLGTSPVFNPYVIAAQNGDRKKLNDLPGFVGALGAAPLGSGELVVFGVPDVVVDSFDAGDGSTDTDDPLGSLPDRLAQTGIHGLD
ncbi:hypothetical protein FN846DRAFT_893789 [Sphaerosporella brunnea]|uniref:Protein kinase domain-containing protein n=1 Tax=Sphaerosporella brunnea TaxID=1250544 RepID=A0A5J5EL38_9PEZI|nr:hypothetical protein FN846DRAFT_893789 [Sphaerosporella brunnea]